jgi:hypothetical protein
MWSEGAGGVQELVGNEEVGGDRDIFFLSQGSYFQIALDQYKRWEMYRIIFYHQLQNSLTLYIYIYIATILQLIAE